MRKSLFTAAAFAPFALLAGPALADTTVGSTTSPVTTATVNSGAADNVVVGSGATVATDGPASVTLNSNNSVTNNGAININANANNNNTAAVLLQGGFTGSLTNAGTISNTDGYTASTNSTNGFSDGAFAQGTDRYGVRLVGPGALNGSVTLNSGGSITVQGNNSYGVSLESQVIGDVLNAGSIAVTGSNSTGLSQIGGVTGKMQITGAISASGTGSSAVNVGGDVGGALSIYSTISATGYRTTTRGVDPTVNAELTPDQLTISGPALQVGANVGGGVFLGSIPAGTVSTDTTTDADFDGIVDSVEGIGSLTVYGSAPALLVGANGKSITLGQFASQNPYGLILEGNVTTNGVFDTFSATAVQLGAVSGSLVTSGSVNIAGGISVTNTSFVTAQAYQANATAIEVGVGVTTPLLQNAGTITALSTESSSTTAFSTTALQIEQGSSLSQLINTGVINSALTGDLGSAYAVVDKSGTLTSVTNMGTITAKLTPLVATDTTQGSAVALDLSHSTGAVSLIQEANPNPWVNPATTNSSGATVTQASTPSPTSPSITGDILLGSGAANVQFLAGTVNGALTYGAGGGSLLIDNGATYTGALTSGGAVGVNINNGSLTDTSASQVNASSLHIGSSGVLNIAVDPLHNTATMFNVSGAATLDSGAKLGVNVLSLLTAPGQFTVIQSPSLSVAAGSIGVAQTPYLFVADFTSDPSLGTVTLDVRRRTAAEANLNRAEAAAWDPVYNNLGLNPQIQQAFLAQTTDAGLRGMLDQVLPDYAGGVFRALTWASEQQGVAAAEPPLGQDQQGPTRAWTQEIVLDETKRSTADSTGYNLMGVGAVAGLESVSPKGMALGTKISFATVNVRNPDLAGDNLLGVSEIGAGVYWRGAVGALKADAQLGAGFIWANGRREFLYNPGSSGTVVHEVAQGDWNGYSVSGRIGLRYTAELGPLTLEPRVHADYFRMHENGYTETGGGQGFDLAVDPRNGDMMSVTGSILAGMTFGTTGFRWRPQIEVGYRDVILGQAGTTTATFVGGSDPFSLLAEPIKGGSGIARVGVRLYSDYVDVLLDAGGQFASDYTDLDVHLTARTVF